MAMQSEGGVTLSEGRAKHGWRSKGQAWLAKHGTATQRRSYVKQGKAKAMQRVVLQSKDQPARRLIRDILAIFNLN
jgi:hypothetical protein